MKFTHILGLSSIHAIGMATKMVRKAKEQNCKKKQVLFTEMRTKDPAIKFFEFCAKFDLRAKQQKKMGRPAQNYFLISNSKIQKHFFGNYVIPERKKSREKFNFK